MFNLDKFIADSVAKRPVSMFALDIKANAETLTREIKGKKVCVIGGAGSIGSSYDLKQISDCTGGRKMQFDTASQNYK